MFLAHKLIYEVNKDRIGNTPYLYQLSDEIAFDIDSNTHERILRQAKQQPYITPELEAYRSVLKTALIDGVITNDESAMLETLRKETGISEQEHAMLLAELQDAMEE